MTQDSLRARIGNALVLTALVVAALAFATLQGGPWWIATPRLHDWIVATAASIAFLGVCWMARRSARGASVVDDSPDGRDAQTWLIAWASQTGFALELADRTARALREAGHSARLLPIDRIDARHLQGHRRALFLVSTTGEGDPPDHALAFTRQVLATMPALASLEYAVLALGDRTYERFCAFGRALDQWLHRHGAQPLFDRIDVDAGDAGALRHWQARLAQLAGASSLADWSPPAYTPWKLRARRLLNPGSVGAGAYHVELVPAADKELQWTAGDIAEIGPRHADATVAAWLAACDLDGSAQVDVDGGHDTLAELARRSHLPPPAEVRGTAPRDLAQRMDPLPHREYSIASLPSDGALQLLVRRMHAPDGTPGLGSGWLTAHAGIGDRVDVRIRANPTFHPPGDDRPLVLVGNGTGMAGLRALLKARAAAGHRRNWLVFGERQQAHDLHYRDDIDAFVRDGTLAHVDFAFSRDEVGQGVDGRRYVQDALRAQAPRLREWIDAGASVYVCGSLQGMAPGVDAVLRDAVGSDAVDSMAADGRYRRDVY